MTDEDRKLIHQLAKDETIGERIIASIAPSGIITRCFPKSSVREKKIM